MVDKNKAYKTREGREVLIYAVYGIDAKEPVHGAVLINNKWRLQVWNADGKVIHKTIHYEHPDDLIEVKPRIVGWINIYRDTSSWNTGKIWPTQQLAKSTMVINDMPVACIRIEFSEGEGLK